jgi:hypothetical protein
MIQMFEFPLRRTRELLLEQLHQVMDNGSVSIKVESRFQILEAVSNSLLVHLHGWRVC